MTACFRESRERIFLIRLLGGSENWVRHAQKAWPSKLTDLEDKIQWLEPAYEVCEWGKVTWFCWNIKQKAGRSRTVGDDLTTSPGPHRCHWSAEQHLAPRRVGSVPVSISSAFGLQASHLPGQLFTFGFWGSELHSSHLGSKPLNHLSQSYHTFYLPRLFKAKAYCHILFIHK